MPDINLQAQQQLTTEQVLSPQIIQALRILQVPAIELEREITEALAKNPLLEEISTPAEKMKVNLPSETPNEKQKEELLQEELNNALKKDDWKEPTGTFYSKEDDEKRKFMFDSLEEQKPSLPNFLQSQIKFLNVPDEIKNILEILLEHLDEKGFLDTNPASIASETQISQKQIDASLKLLQTFDPPGIGATNLQEAFLIQLQRSGKTESIAYKILKNLYPQFIKRKFSEIINRLDITDRELRSAISEIAHLNRVPAKDFIADDNRIILPDLKFFYNPDKKNWEVEMNSDYIPRLRISNHYKEMLAQGKISNSDRTYISEKIRDGKTLINAIEQRQLTIEAIAKVLARVQEKFLENGPSALKPLTMNTIAAEIGVHETTVSRAVSGKYAETPWGLFELRKFFNAAISTDEGEAVSNASVREVLREIIETEPKESPLSDEKLAAELNARGINVARRTIAKYRSILNIPPAHLRRKF